MISAYWGFVLMSLHLGLHWGMMMGIAKRFVKELPAIGRWLLRGIAVLIAGYGAYAFIQREIGRYMLLIGRLLPEEAALLRRAAELYLEGYTQDVSGRSSLRLP